MAPSAIVTRRAEERIHNGHPWIYRSDVADVTAEAGDMVTVKATNGRALGHAMFSDQSLITLRMRFGCGRRVRTLSTTAINRPPGSSTTLGIPSRERASPGARLTTTGFTHARCAGSHVRIITH